MTAALTLLTIFAALVGTSSCHCVSGYYWKDFYGEIPEDAFPGGTDRNGKPIYIGQIFNGQFLIPAKIYAGDNTAYYAYGYKEHKTTKDIKILCAQNAYQFEWVQTNTEALGLITDRHLVIGGSQPDCTVYIGRVLSNGEILVGKVIADAKQQYLGLHVPSDGKGIQYTTYEVLSYNYQPETQVTAT